MPDDKAKKRKKEVEEEVLEPQHVGDLLSARRKERKIKIEKAATQLNIGRDYLKAIEDGEFDKLPGQVYAVGFIRTYAEFLELDADEMVQVFKDEGIVLESPESLIFPAPLPKRGIPRGFTVLLSLFLVVLLAYVWHTYYRPITAVGPFDETIISETEIGPADSDEIISEEVTLDIDGTSSEAKNFFNESNAAPSEGAVPTTLASVDSSSAPEDELIEIDEIDRLEQEPDSMSNTAEAPPAKTQDEVAALRDAGIGTSGATGEATARQETNNLPSTTHVTTDVVRATEAIDSESIAAKAAAAKNAANKAASAENTDSESIAAKAAAAKNADSDSIAAKAAAAKNTANKAASAENGGRKAITIGSSTAASNESKTPLAQGGWKEPTEITTNQWHKPNFDAMPQGVSSARHGADMLTGRSDGTTSAGVSTQPVVLLNFVDETWFQVKDTTGRIIYSGTLKPGSSYNVPTQPGLRLTTGNAGGMEIYVNGRRLRPIGPSGSVVHNIPLDPDKLLAYSQARTRS